MFWSLESASFLTFRSVFYDAFNYSVFILKLPFKRSTYWLSRAILLSYSASLLFESDSSLKVFLNSSFSAFKLFSFCYRTLLYFFCSTSELSWSPNFL